MTTLILTMDIRSENDVILVRRRARQIASLLDFDPHDQTRIATSVSEIARNAVQHAEGGKVEFQLTEESPQALKVVVKDTGPGIADVETLLKRRRGALPGIGNSIRGACQLMDAFHIETRAGQGTWVTLSKLRSLNLPRIERKDLGRITGELIKRVADDPVAEMYQQNQELLRALEQLHLEQEERGKYLQEIESLNMRLQRSIQATHHRVKNNLQIIAALVDIQTDSESSTVPLAAMTRIGQHTRSLAAIHDLLTQETKTDAETNTISARAIMEKLLPLLQATTGGKRLDYQVEDFPLPAKDVSSLTLLVTELISNAVKHGRSTIELRLRVQDSRASLEVCDDGPGFPVDFDWRRAANTGLYLIDSTCRHDLRGTISYENRPEGGASVIAHFPVSLVG